MRSWMALGCAPAAIAKATAQCRSRGPLKSPQPKAKSVLTYPWPGELEFLLSLWNWRICRRSILRVVWEKRLASGAVCGAEACREDV